jgi:enamine deaminase RidA (YjgF/YER057c/UK114 family)
MELIHVNPPSLHTSAAFSQGVLVRGDHDLLQVGGQNGTDASGAIVPGGIGPQTEQAMRNVLAVLEAAGADQSNVIRMSILLVEGQSFQEGFAAAMPVWGPHVTAITGAHVAGLGRPDALVEIEATAAIPRG